ncbi:MAG: ROK family protein [Acidimicrobiales bacterium]
MAAIGIDLGGTKILAALVEEGVATAKEKRSTPRTATPGNVLDAVAAMVDRLDPEERADMLGIGVPGPVAPDSGVLAMAANLTGWSGPVDVAAELSARCGGRRVVVGNDVNCATLAEARLGAGRAANDLIGVFMGTGVGAGLVLDGHLRIGPRGYAGELGHIYVNLRDFEVSPIGRGELEDYAGRRMMEARARARHDAGESTDLLDLAGEGRMKSSIWAAALDAGDTVASEIVDDAAEALATALASATTLLDIELVVLGGGMAERLGAAFRADLERRVQRRTFGGAAVRVVAPALGSVGPAIGAALFAEETQP